MKLQLPTNRKAALDAGFAAAFGGAPERYFSAPGRTELSGNHTDHQRGRVLAGAVNLDMQAAVKKTHFFDFDFVQNYINPYIKEGLTDPVTAYLMLSLLGIHCRISFFKALLENPMQVFARVNTGELNIRAGTYAHFVFLVVEHDFSSDDFPDLHHKAIRFIGRVVFRKNNEFITA